MIRHRTVRIVRRDKLGLSNPRNRGPDRAGAFSAYRELVVDGDLEGQAGYSVSNSLLLSVKGTDLHGRVARLGFW